MGTARFDRDAPFADQQLRAAAVLCRTEHGNLHAGILFKAADSTARVLHLAWQDILSEDWPWDRLWAAPDAEPEHLASVAGWCRLILARYHQTRSFPYGIAFHNTTFDASGRLVFGPGARGLTCATFILAVLLAAGIQLVDESDWPVREADDRSFLARVQAFCSAEHFELLKADVDAGCKRITPDEVLGACACELPARFAPARAAADGVVGLFRLNQLEQA